VVHTYERIYMFLVHSVPINADGSAKDCYLSVDTRYAFLHMPLLSINPSLPLTPSPSTSLSSHIEWKAAAIFITITQKPPGPSCQISSTSDSGVHRRAGGAGGPVKRFASCTSHSCSAPAAGESSAFTARASFRYATASCARAVDIRLKLATQTRGIREDEGLSR